MKRSLLCALILSGCVTAKAPAPVAPIQSCQSQAEELVAALPHSSRPIGDKQLTSDVYLLAIGNDDQSVDVMVYVRDGTDAVQQAKKDEDFKFVGKCEVNGQLVYIFKHHQVPQGA